MSWSMSYLFKLHGIVGRQKVSLDELFHALWARLQADLMEKLARAQISQRKEQALEAQERAGKIGPSSQGYSQGSFNSAPYARRPYSSGSGGNRFGTGNLPVCKFFTDPTRGCKKGNLCPMLHPNSGARGPQARGGEATSKPTFNSYPVKITEALPCMYINVQYCQRSPSQYLMQRYINDAHFRVPAD
jgi:hypothetical protein